MFGLTPVLTANRPTLYFIYGLAFFLLGFTVLVQQRKTSNLKLAHKLPWLAIFALIHGLAEWGYLFIPLNEHYLSIQAVEGLRVIQVWMFIISFIFLVNFGLSFFPWSKIIQRSFLVFVYVGSVTIISLWVINPAAGLWLAGDRAEIAARYFLCIPGSVLSAAGLYRQREELKKLGSGMLLRYLELAVISFIGYAVAGGLVVPELAFFPADTINTGSFNRLLGFPVELLRAGLGTLMALSILNVLRMFDLEDRNRVAEVNRREALAKERERISRDMHDGVIQSVYAVGLILQKIKKTGPEDEQWRGQIETVLKSLDDVVTDIRRYIQNLLPQNEEYDLTGVVNWLEESPDLPVEVKTVGKTRFRLSPQAVEHINLIIREALTNVSKHADATKATVCFQAKADGLELEISDNGTGRREKPKSTASGIEKLGLKNIRARSAALNGTCDIEFTNQGTCVRIQLPWEGNVIWPERRSC